MRKVITFLVDVSELILFLVLLVLLIRVGNSSSHLYSTNLKNVYGEQDNLITYSAQSMNNTVVDGDLARSLIEQNYKKLKCTLNLNGSQFCWDEHSPNVYELRKDGSPCRIFPMEMFHVKQQTNSNGIVIGLEFTKLGGFLDSTIQTEEEVRSLFLPSLAGVSQDASWVLIVAAIQDKWNSIEQNQRALQATIQNEVLELQQKQSQKLELQQQYALKYSEFAKIRDVDLDSLVAQCINLQNEVAEMKTSLENSVIEDNQLLEEAIAILYTMKCPKYDEIYEKYQNGILTLSDFEELKQAYEGGEIQ